MGYENGKLQVQKLWPDRGPPLNLTLHHALRMGNGEQVPCYVLRRQAMPTYDSEGKVEVDESTCDGRFRQKLHGCQEDGLVTLCPHWKPGPHVPPLEYYEKQNAVNKAGEESESSDDGAETDQTIWLETGCQQLTSVWSN